MTACDVENSFSIDTTMLILQATYACEFVFNHTLLLRSLLSSGTSAMQRLAAGRGHGLQRPVCSPSAALAVVQPAECA